MNLPFDISFHFGCNTRIGDGHSAEASKLLRVLREKAYGEK
jgi:hypothetical protein